MPEYYSAAVCRRGHVETSVLELNAGMPARRCTECGAPILTECAECHSRVRGTIEGYLGSYEPPDFCDVCACPYPWASRQAIVWHIENQLEEDELPEGESYPVGVLKPHRPADRSSSREFEPSGVREPWRSDQSDVRRSAGLEY
jgi:hypothetical protein